MSFDKSTLPSGIKLESKKREFFRLLDGTFQGVSVKDHLLDVLVFAMRAAELHFFSSKGRKTGSLKKECILAWLKAKVTTIDEPMISNMVESMHTTIPKVTYVSRLKRWAGKFVFRSGAGRDH